MDADFEYKRITLTGFVQGVGLRPHVRNLAVAAGVAGSVRNGGGAAVIEACAARAAMEAFIASLRAMGLPALKIERFDVIDAEPFLAEGFTIEPSGPGGAESLFPLPDLPVCERCVEETRDPAGRRGGYLLNACTSCGPRFTIIERMPYDRENNAMRGFPPCVDCEHEYADPADRRFHDQAVACPACGPEYTFLCGDEIYRGADALDKLAEVLLGGEIAAIKGVGGYHLACSPFDREAAARLRLLKGRENKPFALMFLNADACAKYCRVGDAERELLQGPARPITLLDMPDAGAFAPDVLRGDARCGCMLPYTALHHALLPRTGPLVMTSANFGGSPIITDDSAMLEFYRANSARIAGIMAHPRRIVRSAEDSVAQIADGGAQLIRRSRGYVPAPFALGSSGPQLVALGGDLKAAFCFTRGDRAFPSQYFGDLEHTSDEYERALRDFRGLFRFEPKLAVCDRHPGYISRRIAYSLGLPVLEVQHHHAHAASVMAEHGLAGPVVAAVFDGTGYGDDGGLWGGEFLFCEGSGAKRVGHLAPAPLLGGDAASAEPDRTALCMLRHCGLDAARLPDIDGSDIMLAALDRGVNAVRSTSMGRLFDAVAATVIADETTGHGGSNTYEGECAVRLQQAAEAAMRRKAAPLETDFVISEQNGVLIADWRELLLKLADCSDPGAAALGFHMAAARMCERMCSALCERNGTRTVALSGGVFQNRLLLESVLELLRAEGLEVYFNRRGAPNDNSLALGQAWVGREKLKIENGKLKMEN